MVDIAPDGRLAQDPVFIELNACPFYRVEVNGTAGVEGLAERYADREPARAYVEVTLRYDASKDNTLDLEREIRRVFRRIYRFKYEPIGAGVEVARPGDDHHDVATTARTYVSEAIQDDVRRGRVLTLLDELLKEVVA
jgi:hypothetical protein